MMCMVLDVESQYEGVVTQSEEVGVHEAFIDIVGVNTPHNRYHNHFYSSIMYDLDNLQWGDYGGDYGGVVQNNLRNE